MNKIAVLATIASAALAGAAFLSAAAPAAAKDYEFCQQDYSSAMRSCGFETMEQCVAMISGRGGSCMRNPFQAETSGSYASAPKAAPATIDNEWELWLLRATSARPAPR